MKFVILVAMIAVVAANNAYKAAPPAYETPVTYPPRPYSFNYDVKDKESYADFVHSESSDTKVTTGSYRVELPDGRTQIVSYRADENGYTADVTYEGEAQYPEYKEPEAKAAPAAYAPEY
ncbi:pro-resilin-like [Daphnia pulex]|uniref:pro-resilin-like n=1 Tax=Daphnia pulex TaxID=6669 RepID=UPI001EDD5ACB|nr:pro-resilin-like [Daphnia pulex]